MTMTKKERAAEAVRRLKEIYPDAVCSLTYSGERPYELVISTRTFGAVQDARCKYCKQQRICLQKSVA